MKWKLIPLLFTAWGSAMLINTASQAATLSYNSTNSTWTYPHKTVATASRLHSPIISPVSLQNSSRVLSVASTVSSRPKTSTLLTVKNSTTNVVTKAPVSAATALPFYTHRNTSWSFNHLTGTAPRAQASGSPILPISHNDTWAYSRQNSSMNRVAAAATKPKGVFAHFMVGNCKTWSVSQWQAEMRLAQSAKIDAFALNIAYHEGIDEALAKAFDAADSVGFKLFFSFDYAGNGPWPQVDVIILLGIYKDRGSHYRYNDAPFVSTFEGPDNAIDWVGIKSITGCFFMPDWSSRGAKEALELANGVADGLFSWAAWPWGNTDMNTYVDASYRDYLNQAGGKPYMMPVSPWFYTNMPGFKKNWLWRGDDLWRDRWEQVLWVQPEFVEIISWNDYGESHYVGPLHDDGYEAFATDRGNTLYNYALDMPHTGWLTHVPFWIDMYKNGISKITQESLVIWYRLYPGASVACSFGGTTGNTASQLLLEFPPNQVAQDKIFFSMALTQAATVSVTVGGVAIAADWSDKPFEGVGIWHGSAAYGSSSGTVQVTVSRGGNVLAQVTGKAISTACTAGVANWNAWVGVDTGRTVTASQPSLNVNKQVCVRGTAPGNFQGICDFDCYYGYCPLGACQCLEMGKQRTLPKSTGVKGYPASGLGSSYLGLCDFACNIGYCPAGTCGTTKYPLVEPTISPFLPPYCVQGTGPGQLLGLCSYSCNFGFCPIQACTCLSTGSLTRPPPSDNSQASLNDGSDDYGLCSFACSRGFCPDVCISELDLVPGCDDEDESEGCEEFPVCVDELEFDTFDALDNFDQGPGAYMPTYCKQKFAMQVLFNEFNNAMSDYNSIDSNYDDRFDYYVEYMRSRVPAVLHQFMDLSNGDGNKYFTCKLNSDGESEPCPIDDYSNTGTRVGIYYTLIDEEGFYNDLATEYGILRDWIEIGTESTSVPVCSRTGCSLSINLSKYGFPISKGSAIVIPNPKDIILGALPKADGLLVDIGTVWIETLLGTWDANLDDSLQVLSIPVFMFMQAVASMKEIIEIADEAEEEEQKNLILTILSSILLILPFVGEFAQLASGVTNLVRFILLADIAGNAALAAVDIIDSPSSAPMAILGLLFGVGFRSRGDYAEKGAQRRGMSMDDVAKLGGTFKGNDDVLQKLIRACRR